MVQRCCGWQHGEHHCAGDPFRETPMSTLQAEMKEDLFHVMMVQYLLYI